MKKVIAITGPTASGKTDLSIKIAKKFNLEIINCDSTQFYQYYNIGTAKITPEETQGIKHHLLDFLLPEQHYSIYHFQKDARQKINTIPSPLFVGGSGLYLKSALFNYELTPKFFVKKTFTEQELQKMLAVIQEKDPQLVLDIKNRPRIINSYYNAISGHLSSQKTQKNSPLYPLLIFYLDIDRQVLKKRIILRLENMLNQGLIEEVKIIFANFDQANFNIIGYREIKLFLEKKINLDEAKNLIIQKTMQYAKRQKTWFKNQLKPIIIDALSPSLEIEVSQIVSNFLKNKE
ncbi:tRNA (adenosine(37)-N6)-dimethylallyltransferase MiaA [Candidatus Phytoplasma solani]|uniref:tRNA dimethylallyltransferase n=1 Tax=Candidatus Phytoplasma solani TaxID=69896 RepID=A0A421NYS1_9MOLU|nr:tRNA (adenosine(37)-N6)-dimethylallyltransferase MiaA [Candidatus Phytoplasma solani]RMI89163.1 tRNA delta(2)-isopentenylpyrophosphate transferase [Candidatus Phytoplasma solani]CCP88417.1 tRNA dimethylallyltransferase [Candidatus Phytoplasma solani]CCP88722.1 tRNA dimethylallyltransferase [Candidatus Phytoplasma solani]